MHQLLDDSDLGTPEIVFLVVFVSVFVIIISAFVIAIVGGLIRWGRNNRSPLVEVPAVVVAKRGQVRGGGPDSTPSTSYHATFEIRGGERLEFLLRGTDFGQLVERDRGELRYQGSRYRGFIRTPQDR